MKRKKSIQMMKIARQASVASHGRGIMAANAPVLGDDGTAGMRTRQTRAELKRKRSSCLHEGGRSKTRTGNEFTPKLKSKSPTPLLNENHGKSSFSSAIKKVSKSKGGV